MREHFFLFLCLLFSLPLVAQHECTIIASSGLKLRSTPDQRGKVLAVAPFGARVTVKNKSSSRPNGKGNYYVPEARRDTIGILREYTYHDGKKTVNVKEPHIGYWFSVEYDGKSGYMFSGFLMWNGLENERYANPNDTWRVQYAGGNAANSALPDLHKRWNWYGLFRQPDGKYALRAVQLQYAVADYRNENEEGGVLDTEILTQVVGVAEQPLFLIGHIGKLTERSNISGDYAYEKQGESKFMSGYTLPKEDLLRPYDITIQKHSAENEWDYSVFLSNASGKKQEIRLPNLKDSANERVSPFELQWVGDLDGDGRYDYLCNMGDKWGGIMLYLSSQAKSGEAAGLVAVLWHWSIC